MKTFFWPTLAVLPVAWLLAQVDRAAAADRKAPPVKAQVAQVAQPVKAAPVRQQPVRTQPANRAWQQAVKIHAEHPTRANNSTTPKEQTVYRGRLGWDTKPEYKGVVRPNYNTKRVTPQEAARQANDQLKREERARAQRYPAISRVAPPLPARTAPAPQQKGVRAYFSSLFHRK